MKKVWKEFRAFALKGNVMNLAVGVIIGAAFQGMVTSLTDNILSPIIGLFTGQNFDALQWDMFGITLRYGAFITSVINFFIMAFVVFLMVKGMNEVMSLGRREDEKPLVKKCPYCLSDIPIAATRCSQCTSWMNESKNHP